MSLVRLAGVAKAVRDAGLPIVCLLSTACGASRFDQLYEAESFEQAIALYQADGELQNRERALYRAAQMRSRPQSAVYDPEAARRDLRRLLERFPGTVYREAASVQLALLDEVIRLREDAERSVAAIGSLEREVTALRQESERLAEDLGEREERIELLRLLVDALRQDLGQRQRQLAALEQELERLKAIDLGQP